MNTTSEIFQNIIRQILANIPNVINISDDILVFGKTEQEHYNSLQKVFNQLNAKGLTVNERKCNFNVTELNFFGHIFSAKGIRPDPEKISTIE